MNQDSLDFINQICNVYSTFPLKVAIQVGNLKAISALIELKVNVNEVYRKDDFYQETPLMIAVKVEREDIIDMLIEAGAYIDTPSLLIESIRNKNTSIVEKLIENKAKVNDKINDDTPLMAAIQYQSIDIVRKLIETGASVNLKTKHASPIFRAIEHSGNGSADLLDELIKNGANVNSKVKGISPLVFSLEMGASTSTKTLIMNGADLDLKSRLLDGYRYSKHSTYFPTRLPSVR